MLVRELFEIQAEQQRRDFGADPRLMTDQQRAELVDELVLCLYEEVGELARSVRSKPHIVQERVSIGNTLDGLADVFKVALSIADASGITADQLRSAVIQKTEVIRARRHQYLNQMASGVTVFVTDLDGCVADINPFIRDVQGGAYGAQAGSIDIERRKADWYEAGGFLDLPVIEGAAHALRTIRDAGHKVAIITARPSWVHRRVAWDTQEWLKKNDIHYDVLAFDKDKYDALVRHVLPAKVLFFVEDRDKHAMEIAAQRIPVLLMDAEYNRHVANSEHVNRVLGWRDILASLVIAGHLA